MNGKRILSLLIFLIFLVSLVISCALFFNMGVYVDEAGTSPDVVCGGEFWLNADWARLFLLAMGTVLSGVLLGMEFREKKG